MTMRFDLDIRTAAFASNVRDFLKPLHKHPFYESDIRQVVRSSGSVGANYLEANVSVSRRDFLHRIKICRKEAKESMFWLHLLRTSGLDERKCLELEKEALALARIFSAIILKIESKNKKE